MNPPLSHPGCKTLAGGEKLIFWRDFEGVKEYRPTVEVSQKLVHALDLYYMDERCAYCRLDNQGDFENVITVFDDELPDLLQHVRAIAIRTHDLATYMALSGTALVTKFDFTRTLPKCFSGWGGHAAQIFQRPNLHYHHVVIPNHASYANGHIICRTSLTENDLIEKWEAEEGRSKKKYASFKFFDRKNNRLEETLCGPNHVVSYFNKTSSLPWEISPAFFQPEVLHKYKADLEKYTIQDRSISCRGTWHLDNYDINEAGQVHTYLRYLAMLPYEEQKYWQSFNEWPKSNISKRAWENDILGEVSTEIDPLHELKRHVQALDRNSPVWWKERGEDIANAVLCPATDSPEEWGNALLALDHLVVEGFYTKGLRAIISNRADAFENEWGSLKLLEVALSLSDCAEQQAKTVVAPLKELHNLRNLTKAHGDSKGRRKAIAEARKTHGTLRKHFQDLIERIHKSMKEILSDLNGPNPT